MLRLTLLDAPPGRSFVWFLFPVAFGLDEGGNVIRVTSGVVMYGILGECPSSPRRTT